MCAKLPRFEVGNRLCLSLSLLLLLPNLSLAQNTEFRPLNPSNTELLQSPPLSWNPYRLYLSLALSDAILSGKGMVYLEYTIQLEKPLSPDAEVSFHFPPGYTGFDPSHAQFQLHLNPARDIIQVQISSAKAHFPHGSLFHLQIDKGIQPFHENMVFHNLGGIVQVDLIDPAKMSPQPLAEAWQSYPKPARDHLILQSPQAIEAVELLNLQGKRVYQADGQGKKRLYIYLENLSAGTYLLRGWDTQRHLHQEKIMILH